MIWMIITFVDLATHEIEDQFHPSTYRTIAECQAEAPEPMHNYTLSDGRKVNITFTCAEEEESN